MPDISRTGSAADQIRVCSQTLKSAKAVVVVVARLQCALHVGACCNDGIMDTHSPQNLQGCPAYVDFIAPFQ
jgi:hypothetical protein